MRIPLDRNQRVTVDGRPGVIVKVHYLQGTRTPHAYTVRLEPALDRPEETELLTPDKVAIALVNVAEVGDLLEEIGRSPGWTATGDALAVAHGLLSELAYLRRRLELAEDYTRLGARDGAIAAGTDALVAHMQRAGELDTDVDAATVDSLRELAEAAVCGALPVLAPSAAALQALNDLLPAPCPVPNTYMGYDQCDHGSWPCNRTFAAWIAAGLDPHEERARLLAEERARYIPLYEGEDGA